MKKIEVKILNPDVIKESEKMMVCAARLTQSGHKIKNMNDFIELYNKDYSEKTVNNMISLPHPTIQKFGVINIAVVGASRRFLAQITRHQNEVKFMSASLQYSDYSNGSNFAVPYEFLGTYTEESYLNKCDQEMEYYKQVVDSNYDHDSAGYLAPQGLRNVLIISATPYQWKHMISQRTCRRNTDETRIVMLKIWNELYNLSPMFKNCGPFCMNGNCKEGKMSCGRPMIDAFERDLGFDKTPIQILEEDYPKLFKEKNYESKSN